MKRTFRKPHRIRRLQPAHRFRRRGPLKSIFGNRFFWLTLLVLIIIGGVFYFIAFSSTFQIKEIKISGNQKISSENIKILIEEKLNKKILLFDSKSIFLVNLNEINKIVLEKFLQLSQVNLERKFPNKIIVKIEERKPAAIFYSNENYFLIDKEGVIFEKISELSQQILKIKNLTITTELKLGDKAIEKNKLSQILEIESKLREDLKIPLAELSIASEERINAKTSEGWEIYLNPKNNIDWQLIKLSLILKEKIPQEKRKNLEYIDLRFEKVYIFPETYWQ